MTIEVRNITPAGALDGVNRIFTSPLPFTSRSTAVYVDLGRVRLDIDYTEINSTQIQFTSDLNEGEVVTMDITFNDGVTGTSSLTGNPARAAAMCNPSMVRGLPGDLLTDNSNPTNAELKNIIRSVDSKIGLMMAHRHENPPTPIAFIEGVISVYKNNKVIEGIGTTFTTSLYVGQTMQILGSGEALRIASITSDTSLMVESDPDFNSANTRYWVIPEELVTASLWLSGQAAVMLCHPDKTLKQDNVEKFDRRMEQFAGPIIKILECGKYFNADLKPQSRTKNAGRFLNIAENSIKTANDNFISKVINFK